MDKNKKKRGKLLLSLLLLLIIGTVGSTGYAVATGRMPPIIKGAISIFANNGENVEIKTAPEINMKNTSSEISPESIQDTKTISHKEQESSEADFDPDKKVPENEYTYLDINKDLEPEPVIVTTDTSQDTTSTPSIPAPPNATLPNDNNTNSDPTEPTPSKPTVPPTSDSHKPHKPHHKSPTPTPTTPPTIDSVTLDITELTLTKGDISSPLLATITPLNAAGDKTIIWISENESIAKVDKDGHITAVGAGTTNIIAKTSNSKTAECKITILVPPSGIKINSDNFSIDKGLSKTLTATVEPEDCTDKSVIWATSNNDVLSVDENGKVTAESPGTAIITATTADGKFSSNCEVTVVISISKLELNKTETTLIKGTEETLNATINPPDTTEIKTVQWTSSNENICTVDESGNITAVNGGTATITAQVGSHVAECKVTVIVPASGIAVNKKSTTISKGADETLIATVFPEDATDRVIEWSSSDENICTIDKNGKVTGMNVGTAIITVKTHDGEYKSDCKVTVVIPVTKITLNKPTLMLIKGNVEQLIATIIPNNATDKEAQWTSSDKNICTVDESGKVTAVNGGTATITVTTHDGNFKAECKVTVTVPVTGVALNTDTLKLIKGKNEKLLARITPEDATDQEVEWSSSNPEIATVDENGKVTGIEVGTAVITVKTHDGKFTAQCTVNVVIPVTGIKLDKSELNIIRKDSAVLIPTVLPDNATDKSITWTTSNPDIAVVEEKGKVTGTEVGSAVITATTNDGEFTAECKVTVTPDEYTITANTENGKVTGAGIHHVGSDVTLTAVPNAHYHFVNWTQDGKEISTEPEYIIKNINEDINITANFEIDYHTVTVKAGNGGTVTTESGKFAYGTEVTLTATPKEHYHFVNWSDGTKSATKKLTVTKDIDLSASFEIDTFNVTANGNGGKVTGGGRFAYGTKISLTATPNDGFKFIKWSDGVKGSRRTYTVSDNISITALFKLKPYTWTCKVRGGGDLTTDNGNSKRYSSVVETESNMGDRRAFCDVYYYFTKPLILPAGSTFQVNFRVISGSDKGRGEGSLYFNGNENSRWSTCLQRDCCKNYTYSLSSNEKITSIKVRSDVRSRKHDYTAAIMKVTINQSNGSSFLLNSTGTSDQ